MDNLLTVLDGVIHQTWRLLLWWWSDTHPTSAAVQCINVACAVAAQDDVPHSPGGRAQPSTLGLIVPLIGMALWADGGGAEDQESVVSSIYSSYSSSFA